MTRGSFYDELAPYYDLIYADWEASMRRQGQAIADLVPGPASESRILDVSAGIGTQSLPLAALGYEVTARDTSRASIERLRREAAARGLAIDASTADMRRVDRTVRGTFDAVLSMDNSVPHLLEDADLLEAFHTLRGLLADDGVLLVSVRDYSKVDRSPTSVHEYGERRRGGEVFRLRQEWAWYTSDHYRTTMIVERRQASGWAEIARSRARYYAVPIPHLVGLMEEAGLDAHRAEGSRYFQPVLVARAV